MEPRYVEVLAGLLQARIRWQAYAHCDVWELDENNRQTRLRRLTRSATYEGLDDALRGRMLWGFAPRRIAFFSAPRL